MYIFKLELSEKARGYCMYVFLVIIRWRKVIDDKKFALLSDEDLVPAIFIFWQTDNIESGSILSDAFKCYDILNHFVKSLFQFFQTRFYVS